MGDELHAVLQHLKTHQSMGSLEQETIGEIETAKKYPLDGRNLEISFVNKKKRRLAKSVKLLQKPDVSEIIHVPVSEGDACLIPGTNFTCKSSLWTKLYDFQKIGVEFLCSKFQLNTGGLLADEMGLGKSIQVIAFVSALIDCVDYPILLICPATLIAHWKSEFTKWDPEIVVTREFFAPKKSVCVVSYETFRSSFPAARWSVVILDEAQRIRNPNSKITLAVKQTNCVCRIALSGSPIQNNLSELWSIVDFVAPGKLGTLPTFQEELALPIEKGTKPTASHNQSQLALQCAILVRDLTKSCMLRRLKADFLDPATGGPCLVNKDEEVLFCQLSPEQVEVYCNFLSTQTVKRVLQGEKFGRTFYCLSILRRIANHPDLLLSNKFDVDDYGAPSRSGKLAVLIALLKVWHSEKKRCLVFSQSLGLLDILETTLSDMGYSYQRMDGQTQMSRRAEIMAHWDTSDGTSSTNCFCLLLSTRVGGVGLNLIGASRVVIFDPDWNPMTDAQARERSWRIGQTNDVKIYRLVAADTIEEVICKRQIYKHHLAKKILIDPRQEGMKEWDNVHDFFTFPKCRKKTSKSVQKICSLFDKQQIQTEEDSVPNESLSSLVTKVWNQDLIEMPVLCRSLVDSDSVDAAAARAVAAVLSESKKIQESADITVPTYTGSSLNRSQNLLARINTHVEESDSSLVVEKSIVNNIRHFFKRNKSSSTEAIVSNFQIPEGHSELFRSCLRHLCDFKNGQWTLKIS